MVDIFGEGVAFGVGEDFLVVFESFVEAVLLEFGYREDLCVVDVVVFVLGVEHRIELILYFRSLSEETERCHQKLLLLILYTYSYLHFALVYFFDLVRKYIAKNNIKTITKLHKSSHKLAVIDCFSSSNYFEL